MREKAKGTGQGSLAAKGEYWEQLVAEWRNSGHTQKSFCIEQGLVLSTFRWWCSRTKRQEETKAVKQFLPIPLGTTSVVEIELPSRTRIRFEGEAAFQATALLAVRVK